MQIVLEDYLYDFVLVFVDDILIFSKNPKEHTAHVQKVFNTLRKANLKLNKVKCEFGLKEVKYIRFKILGEGILVNPEKV